MKVLITGAAGFIGSHLVEEYLKRRATVYGLDDFSTGFFKNLPIHKNLVVIKGSVLNKQLVDALCKKVDIVEHLAAELEVYEGIRSTYVDAQKNIFGTLNVLHAAQKYKVKRVHYASSGSVYGKHTEPVNEMASLEPHWPYGVSKLCGEMYAMQYYRLYGMKVACFRYSLVYGEREWYGRVLTMFLKRIVLENKPPVIFGDGEQVRDFVYVKDVVNAHMNAHSKGSCGIFNISSGVGITVKELATQVLKLTGSNLQPVFDDPVEGNVSPFQPNRIRLPGELRCFVLENDKAKWFLSWCPKVTFQEGLQREIEWLRYNSDRWNVKPRV